VTEIDGRYKRASDALAILLRVAVMGGALIIVGEDYGEGSSIMQERSHAFAMKSQMWWDARQLPSVVTRWNRFALSKRPILP